MKLFDKVTLGRQMLKNGIAMAPMTRSRANSEGVVNDLTIIYAQLWHTGRVGHTVDRKGKLPVAPSALVIKGQHFTSQGLKDYEIPRELTTEEIKL
jgi:2,4-dienoyl-CoA reductase-like NADH-dependent reductase (Old Yellow Enzyme family)